jgi:cytochrome c551
MNCLNKWGMIFAMIILTIGFIAACGGATNEQTTPTDEAPAEGSTENETTTDESNEEGTADETDTEDTAENTTDDNAEDTGADESADKSAGNADAIAAGEAVVNRSCISCHGANLEGGYGPTLQNIGEEYNKEEIINILINGKGSMPGNLAEGQEEAVAEYLLSLQ